jgi:hypothetical protein
MIENIKPVRKCMEQYGTVYESDGGVALASLKIVFADADISVSFMSHAMLLWVLGVQIGNYQNVVSLVRDIKLFGDMYAS